MHTRDSGREVRTPNFIGFRELLSTDSTSGHKRGLRKMHIRNLPESMHHQQHLTFNRWKNVLPKDSKTIVWKVLSAKTRLSFH